MHWSTAPSHGRYTAAWQLCRCGRHEHCRRHAGYELPLAADRLPDRHTVDSRASGAGKTPAFNGAIAVWLRPFQRPLYLRVFAFGLASLVVIGDIAVTLLAASGVQVIPFAWFIGAKALYAGALAAIVTPMIAWLALVDR